MRMVIPSPAAGRLMDDLATDVGTLFESFFGDVGERSRNGEPRGRLFVPMDIDELDDAFVITLDVPGVPLEAIAIDVHEDTLTISGRRGQLEDATERVAAETESDAGEDRQTGQPAPSVARPRRRERTQGSFERKVQLPLAVEADAVTAELSEGVLQVRLPKADPDKGKRRIPVTKR